MQTMNPNQNPESSPELLNNSTRLTPPTRPQDIQGWMDDTELAFLTNLAACTVDYVRTCRSRFEFCHLAEVGSWKGRSTFALASGLEPVNSNPTRRALYAIDHWLGSPDERGSTHAEAMTTDVYAEFMYNMAQFHCVHTVRGHSVEAATNSLVSTVLDGVFIDASHTYPEVLTDLALWGPRATLWIAGHDWARGNGVDLAVRRYAWYRGGRLKPIIYHPAGSIWLMMLDSWGRWTQFAQSRHPEWLAWEV
jgi:hypothetical protein